MSDRPIFIWLLLLAGLINALTGANLSNPRAMAMAGAYGGIGLGVEAVCANPANLALSDRAKFSASVLQISAFAYNDAFAKDDYDRYNGAYLDDRAKRDLLEVIHPSGLFFRGRVEAQPLAISYGAFALSVSLQAGGNGHMDKELFELALLGNTVDRTFQFQPLLGQATAISSYIFSYGFSLSPPSAAIQHWGAGVNIKYLRGHALEQVQSFEAETSTSFTATTAKGLATVRSARGGNGFGADIGMSATFFQYWRASLVVENIVGQIKWNHQPERVHAAFVLLPRTVEKIVADDLDFDEVVESEDTTLAIPGFIDRQPLTFRFGVVRVVNQFLLSAELEKSSKKSALTSAAPVFALGAEYQLGPVLRFRAGLRLGGELPAAVSGGFGLSLAGVRWDLAVMPMSGLVPAAMKGIGLATGFFIRF